MINQLMPDGIVYKELTFATVAGSAPTSDNQRILVKFQFSNGNQRSATLLQIHNMTGYRFYGMGIVSDVFPVNVDKAKYWIVFNGQGTPASQFTYSFTGITNDPGIKVIDVTPIS